MPPSPLPEQPGRTPVPARNGPWREYHDRNCHNWTPRDTVIAKAAFFAGYGAVNHEQVKLDTSSLFPTVGVDDAH